MSRDAARSAAVMAWIAVVLLTDRVAGPGARPVLAVATWLVLLVVLQRESPLVRAQTAVVVGFATLVEYTFSPLLHVYVYRDGGVPGFVPPGHGLTYLAALLMGRSVLVHRHLRTAVTVTVVLGGAYALWGLVLSGRLDVLGAFWFGCLLAFLRWGPSRPLYVGAFVVVTYLELLGTSLGTWTWALRDPTGIVAIGNPPSGAAGGYGWFDLAALLAAPGILRVLSLAVAARRAPRRAAARWSPQRFPMPDPDGPSRR